MMVHVRRYAQRRRVRRVGFQKPVSHSRRNGAPSLASLIESVTDGRRSGYTYTGGWKFDIDDPADMERIYDKLGTRVLYAIATTNLPLAERVRRPEFGETEGVSLWRRSDGTVFMDDIFLLFGPKVSEEFVLSRAKSYNQQVILKVDGLSQTWEFVNVPGWDVKVHEVGGVRTFEPIRTK